MATLGIQTVDRLRDDIVSGKIPPGMLIRDADVAAQLGISTIPLREALVQLASEGLVEVVPHRYRRVTPLSRRHLLEMHAVFQVLAFAAYKQGVERLTADDLARMAREVAAQTRSIAKHDWLDYVKAGARANAIVYAASGNEYLARMLAQMSNVLARVSVLVRPREDRLINNRLHQQILAALKLGRRKRAIELFEKMIVSLYDLIAQLPEEAVTHAPPARAGRRPARRSR